MFREAPILGPHHTSDDPCTGMTTRLSSDTGNAGPLGPFLAVGSADPYRGLQSRVTWMGAPSTALFALFR